MPSNYRSLLTRICLLAFAVVGAVVAMPTSAEAATATAMVNTQRMSGPSLNTSQSGWYNRGTSLALSCYVRGQAVRGYYSASFPNGLDDLWYKVSDGYYTADVDINTGSN